MSKIKSKSAPSTLPRPRSGGAYGKTKSPCHGCDESLKAIAALLSEQTKILDHIAKGFALTVTELEGVGDEAPPINPSYPSDCPPGTEDGVWNVRMKRENGVCSVYLAPI